MKKINEKKLKPNTAIKKSSSKTSQSQTSLTEGKASLQSKRAANRPQQSKTEIVSDITSRKGLELALQESEEAFQALAESVPQIVWATRADGWNIFFNDKWVKYTGLTLEESYGHGWNIPFHPDDKQRSWDAWQQATKHGATYSLEVRLRRADGVYRWWLVRGAPLLDTTGRIIKWFGTCTDIDDLKQAERRQALSTEILGILNNPLSMDEAISKIITVLKGETGFDAIGIRLQRGDDFPYIAQDGFSKDFILAENTLTVHTQDGGVCVDKDGNVCLECTCGMVISGKTDPTNPMFTPNGSCWTNESFARAEHPIEDKRLHPRDRCIHEGYHSVALIPLRADKRIIGILQLNDHRPNQFTLEMISFLENMGALIGIAVARKRAEDEMHKAKERADALNLELETANKELEERVATRTADLSRTNEQLRQEVGERRRAEDRLRESEMRMERAQEIAHLGSWELDLVSNHLSWSDEVYRIFGLQPREFGATYEAFLDRVHPDDRAAVDSAYAGSLREGRDSYEIEHRVVRKSDEEVRIVHEKCEHFRNESGAIIRSIGMVHDITERKQAEEVQGRLAAIIESAEDAIIGEDLNGIIQSWNVGAENIFGYAAEEVIGKHVSILVPSGRVDEIQDILAWIKDRERIANLETERIRKDGTIIPVSLTVSAIKDANGRIIGASKIAHDITDRKLAEEALRSSEEQFRALADSIPNLAWWANGDGYITWYNQRWYEYTGTTPEQMEGWGWQSVHDPEVLPKVLERWKASIAASEPFDMDFPLRGSDGIFRSFLTRIMPLKDSTGRVLRWFGTNTDISALKQANEELEAANKEMEAFIYSVSHDLRGPLRGISGFSQMLLEGSMDYTDDKKKNYLNRIYLGAAKMGQLIEDLLRLSHISRQEMTRINVDLSSLAIDIVAELRQCDPDRKVEVKIEEGIAAFADPGLMRVLLSNLLDNTWKFTSRTEDAQIEFATVNEGGRTVYCVKDNGSGFNQEYANKMFLPFHRLHGNEEFEGTGIGLAIVERIIRRHGGRIWAEGQENNGATVSFMLDTK
jgi:PAS domain S-box-containing protein